MAALVDGLWYGMGFAFGACWGVASFILLVILMFPTPKMPTRRKPPGG
jgi:hypothetical protein